MHFATTQLSDQGAATLFADALSMGLGEYLGIKAEWEFNSLERKRCMWMPRGFSLPYMYYACCLGREEWEVENDLEGEKREMVDLFCKSGLSKEDSTAVIEVVSKHKEFFIDMSVHVHVHVSHLAF